MRTRVNYCTENSKFGSKLDSSSSRGGRGRLTSTGGSGSRGEAWEKAKIASEVHDVSVAHQ